jgi:hypothetical protein
VSAVDASRDHALDDALVLDNGLRPDLRRDVRGQRGVFGLRW